MKFEDIVGHGDHMKKSEDIILNYNYITLNKNYDFYGINSQLFEAYLNSYDEYLSYLAENFQLTDQIRNEFASFSENIAQFLSTNNQKHREDFAKEIIKDHWKTSEKSSYNYFIDKLGDSELAIKLIDKFHRDHLVHSVYVFLLGLYLYQNDAEIKKSFEKYDNYPPELELNQFIFMWNIISTFHDVAYPFESFSNDMNSYLATINESNEINNEKSSYEISFDKLDVLSEDRNSFEIMNNILNKDGFSYLKTYFELKLKKGFIDHGILASLFLLKTTNNLYSIKGWDENFFGEVFSEIALAIAIHNIDWDDVSKSLKINKEELPKITLKDFPFCYLLILADNLQEWDRQAVSRPTIPTTAISLVFDDNIRNYDVKIALSHENVEKINKELKMKLSKDDGKNLPNISTALEY